MKTKQTLVSCVLSQYLRNAAGTAGRSLTDDESDLLCRLGLGPVAHRLAEAGNLHPSAAGAAILRGADLTSRLLYRQLEQAIIEVIDAMAADNIRPLLLKGISAASQLYEPAHARLMGDVDLLVAPDEADRAAATLVTLGYTPDEREALGGEHHHLPAVRHPQTGVIIELHTDLFPPGSVPSRESLFERETWRRQMTDSGFGERRIRRFRLEYQLAYTLAHWATERKWPVSVFPYLDAALLAREPALDWAVFGRWMDESRWFATLASLMFTTLQDGGLATFPDGIVVRVDTARRRFGSQSFRWMQYLTWSIPLKGRDNPHWLLNHRAARAAWRSMLAPASLGRLSLAAIEVIGARLSPARSALMQRLRTWLRPLRRVDRT